MADVAGGERKAVGAAVLDEFIYRHGLAPRGAPLQWKPLTGGVSSDIWRVDTPGGPLCVKRALSRLKVAADWQAPLSRNAYEWEWLRFAAQHAPGSVPDTVAHDAEEGIFAMAFLDPAQHPVWKQQLMEGRVSIAAAGEVGRILAQLHAASAGDAEVAARFDTYDNFHALRLEPYLLATAAKHPDLQERLKTLAEQTGSARIALVHGDVSPKNILIGPHGPVFIDAECAWYGDPAFDLAFCLNHLLLKCTVHPRLQDEYLAAFAALRAAYLDGCTWEPARDLEARASALLAALLLARIDGKSPVEYITDEALKQRVRRIGRALVAKTPERLSEIADHWATELCAE